MVLNVDYVYLDKVFYKEYGKDYPQSDVKKWNFNIKIKNSHNCYAYALNKISHKLKDKPQPGLFSHTHNSHSCKNYKIAIKNEIILKKILYLYYFLTYISHLITSYLSFPIHFHELINYIIYLPTVFGHHVFLTYISHNFLPNFFYLFSYSTLTTSTDS